MVKVALIGLGKMGLSHCAILNAHPNVQLVGAADTSKFLLWGLGKYSEIPVFSDFQKMINETNPDCVVIATPTRTHFDIAKFCLESGKNVFLEKPCCLRYEETIQLRDLAREKALLVQVGYHNRFIGTFREVKRMLDDNEIGKIYHFAAEAYGPVVIQEKAGTWRSNRNEGGGCLYDYASHVINLVGYLLGDVQEVRGTRLDQVFSKGVEDTVYSTMILQSGVAGQLAVSWSEESFRKMTTSIVISGTKGRVEVDSQELKVYLSKKGNPTENSGWHSSYLTDHTPPVDYYLRGEEYSAQIDDFVSKVESQSTQSVNAIDDASETDRVVEMLIKDSERDYSDFATPDYKSSVRRLRFWPRLKLLFGST